MWPSAALSVHLTTSWVCASQSAKSIRSKSEKNKGVEASGFPGCHGNTQGHTLVVSCFICLPGGLFLTEDLDLQNSQVVRQHQGQASTLMDPEEGVGFSARSYCPCPQHRSERQEEGFFSNSKNNSRHFQTMQWVGYLENLAGMARATVSERVVLSQSPVGS